MAAARSRAVGHTRFIKIGTPYYGCLQAKRKKDIFAPSASRSASERHFKVLRIAPHGRASGCAESQDALFPACLQACRRKDFAGTVVAVHGTTVGYCQGQWRDLHQGPVQVEGLLLTRPRHPFSHHSDSWEGVEFGAGCWSDGGSPWYGSSG